MRGDMVVLAELGLQRASPLRTWMIMSPWQPSIPAHLCPSGILVYLPGPNYTVP